MSAGFDHGTGGPASTTPKVFEVPSVISVSRWGNRGAVAETPIPGGTNRRGSKDPSPGPMGPGGPPKPGGAPAGGPPGPDGAAAPPPIPPASPSPDPPSAARPAMAKRW